MARLSTLGNPDKSGLTPDLTGFQPLRNGSVTDDKINASSKLAVVTEAPLNINYAPYNGSLSDAITAVNALAANNDYSIYVPSGVTEITAELPDVTHDRVTIFGDGPTSSSLVVPEGTTTVGGMFTLTGLRQTVRDLRIELEEVDNPASGYLFDCDGSNDTLIQNIFTRSFGGILRLGVNTQAKNCVVRHLTGNWNAQLEMNVIRIYNSSGEDIQGVDLSGGGGPSADKWMIPAAYIYYSLANAAADNGNISDCNFQYISDDVNAPNSGYWYGLLVDSVGAMNWGNKHFANVTLDHVVHANCMILHGGTHMRHNSFTDCRWSGDAGAGARGVGVFIANNGSSDMVNQNFTGGALNVAGENAAIFSGGNEVQNWLVDATAGTYTLTWSGQTTAAIDFDATPAEVETALEALSNIGSGDVRVFGGPGNIAGRNAPYCIVFTGSLGQAAQPEITADDTNLTGGAATVTVDTHVNGQAGDTTVGVRFGMPIRDTRAGGDTSRRAAIVVAQEDVTVDTKIVRTSAAQWDYAVEAMRTLSELEVSAPMNPAPLVRTFRATGSGESTLRFRDLRGRLGELVVVKTADETVQNDTLQNDNELSFAIKANEKWFVELFLDVVGVSTTADLKMDWSVPASATFKWGLASDNAGVAVGSTPAALGTGNRTAGLGNLETMVRLAGWITNSSTAGTAQFRWAQNTTTAEDVTVKAGSLIRATRIPT